MFLDGLLEFDAKAGVAITVTRDSTNIIDVGAQRDMGAGDNSLSILCQITQAFTTADGALLTVALHGAPDNAGVPGAFIELARSPNALAAANMTLGRELAMFDVPLWSQAIANSDINIPRFYKLVYTVTVGTFTAGKVAAYMTPKFGRDQFRAYPFNSGLSNQYI